ncbi:DUF58 domain-containing protein [Microbacterium amylolyticum]|uniref:Uncharacterized protein (DUF58 family) n=1 Tax=Microbacterium amylolyticum TaxID=936337 RepID=A0ABS4ZKH8_9MICO|nr:DUF58 domain-containing protein [Microbacterium amylolyticum]MBP2437445.1 uncharacterized protein (DUF58 family) [Microbacterium amylolyticum]
MPTWRGVGLVVAGITLAGAGALTSRVELAFFGLVMVLAAVFAGASLFVVRAPHDVSRELSDAIVPVGAEVEIRVRAKSHGLWAIDDADDMIATGIEPLTSAPPRIANGALRVTYAVSPLRRGVHDLGPLYLTTMAPLRVATRAITGGETHTVTATPRVWDLTPFHRLAAAEGDSSISVDQAGPGSANLIPRPFAHGDSVRRVHWRASAHHGVLMVRDEEQETVPTALVVLDLAAESWPSEEIFDTAASACGSVCARLVADGYAVDVVTGDGAALATVTDAHSVDELLLVLATVEPVSSVASSVHASGPVGVTVAIWGAHGDIPVASATGASLLLAATEEVSDRARNADWASGCLNDGVRFAWNACAESAQ